MWKLHERDPDKQSEEQKMIDVGRICLKIAGKDAGKKVVVVDVLEGNFVMIDGDVKRKRCNIAHLEPLEESVPLKKNALHEDVVKALGKIGIEIKESKKRERKEKPLKKRGVKKPAEKTKEKK